MIVKQGEWEYWHDLISDALGVDEPTATSITFQDDMAWLTPKEQGPAEFVLKKDGVRKVRTGVTQGPRFRKSKCIITFKDASGKILFTNAPKPKRKSN